MQSSPESEKSKPGRSKALLSTVGAVPIVPARAYMNQSFQVGIRRSGHRLWTCREHVMFCRAIEDMFPAQHVFGSSERVENVKLIMSKLPEILNIQPYDVWEYLGALGVDMRGIDAPAPLEIPKKYLRTKFVRFQRETKENPRHLPMKITDSSSLSLRIGAIMSEKKLPTRIESEEVFRLHYRANRRGCFDGFHTGTEFEIFDPKSLPDFAFRGKSFEDLVQEVYSEMVKAPEENNLDTALWVEILNCIVMIERFRLEQFFNVSVDRKGRICLLCKLKLRSRSDLEAHLIKVHDDLFHAFENYLISEGREPEIYIPDATLVALVKAREQLHRPRKRRSSKVPCVPDNERLSRPVPHYLNPKGFLTPGESVGKTSASPSSSSSSSAESSMSYSPSSSCSDAPDSSSLSDDSSVESRSLLSMVTTTAFRSI